MKPIFYRLILAFGLGSAALSAQAGYICKVDGNAVFTEKKIGNDCTESHTDGTANVSPEEAGRAVPERVDLKEALGEAAPEPGDIKVLPRTTGGSVTNTAEAANPRLDIKLRNGKLGEATAGIQTQAATDPQANLGKRSPQRTSGFGQGAGATECCQEKRRSGKNQPPDPSRQRPSGQYPRH